MLHLTDPAAEATRHLVDVIGRHGRGALSFSGGKDSTVCAWLLRPIADKVTLYCCDTGDLLPETQAVIEQVAPLFPHFVMIRRDTAAWIAEHGLPSDLVPYQSHPIGRMIGQASRPPLVSKYDCCYSNIMLPLLEAIKQDGHTLLIRGTKTVDMPRLPISDGGQSEGLEVCYPLQDWTDAEVMQFLREHEAPVSKVYAYEHASSSLDCATCPGWWKDRRGPYLKANHPGLFTLHQARLRQVVEALRPTIGEFVDAMDGSELGF
jgi:phosphoadenosine phosphosulfate reductase